MLLSILYNYGIIGIVMFVIVILLSLLCVSKADTEYDPLELSNYIDDPITKLCYENNTLQVLRNIELHIAERCHTKNLTCELSSYNNAYIVKHNNKTLIFEIINTTLHMDFCENNNCMEIFDNCENTEFLMGLFLYFCCGF